MSSLRIDWDLSVAVAVLLGVSLLALTPSVRALGPASIDYVTDSLGHTQTNSWGAGEGGNWPPSVQTPITVGVGSAITFTVYAHDPDGDAMEYRFEVQAPGTSSVSRQDWSSRNTWCWVVSPLEYGQNVVVLIATRDSDGREWLGRGLGDDYTYCLYDVVSAQASQPALINSVTDTMGHVQTNSWGQGTGGGWPPSVRTPITVTIGTTLGFTIAAFDPEGEPLAYKFAVQPPGGSFVTKRDWGPQNQWEWDVQDSEYGANVVVLAAVRDNDGFDFLGPYAGDDYTYCTYNVDVAQTPTTTVVWTPTPTRTAVQTVTATGTPTASTTPVPSRTLTTVPTATCSVTPTATPSRTLAAIRLWLPVVLRQSPPTATPTLTPLPEPTCDELVSDGGFEQGAGGWRLEKAHVVTGEFDWPEGQSGLLLSTEDAAFPEGGAWAESVALLVPPDSKQVTFSFWYRVLTSEPPQRQGSDCFRFYIRKTDGGWYYFHDFLVRQLQPGWHKFVQDFPPLAGRQVQSIQFEAYNDDQYLSSVLIDGVSVQACP